MKESGTEKTPEPPTRRRWRRPWLPWAGAALLLLLIAAAATAEWVLRNAEPILRKRVVATLSDRFHSPVELDALHISYPKNFLVKGSGLRILYLAGPSKPDANPSALPMLTVRNFEFTTGLRELLEPTARVVTVHVQGMQIDIPPRQERGAWMSDNANRPGEPHWGIAVDKVVCTETTLVLETSKPGKKPLVFHIGSLTLTAVGANKPFNYEAVLVNPKPVGDVHATGHVGPWQAGNPRDTPVDGAYQFTHADLSTIRGIGGILSSTGKFGGTLGEITVDGVTDTPDFRLDVSDHPVALHTDFHAIVDGATGDTRLDPVRARVLHSTFTATGAVTRTAGVPGHDTELNIVMDKGRVEDMLVLGAKTTPPLLRGSLAMRTSIGVPPGAISMSKKLRMRGTFAINDATFNNQMMQEKIDALSMRARGNPDAANTYEAEVVKSAMSGNFSLSNRILWISRLTYQMPGAQVQLNGQYEITSTSFEFHGTVRTQATASQMTTGWKSLLLTPLDPLFKQNGAGFQAPIEVTGAHSAYDIKLDYGH